MGLRSLLRHAMTGIKLLLMDVIPHVRLRMAGTALLQTRLATQLAVTQKLLQTNNVMTLIL